MNIAKPDEKKELVYGDLKITMKHLNVIEGLKYVPVVNFLVSNFGLDPKLVNTLNKQLEKAKKDNDKKKIEQLSEQIEKLSRSNATTALTKLSKRDTEILMDFLTDSIEDWNADLEINRENVSKLPYYILYDIMMVALGMFVVSPGDVDFFEHVKVKPKKSTQS